MLSGQKTNFEWKFLPIPDFNFKDTTKNCLQCLDKLRQPYYVKILSLKQTKKLTLHHPGFIICIPSEKYIANSPASHKEFSFQLSI